MGGATSPRVREVQAQDVERETGRLLVFFVPCPAERQGASEESAMTGKIVYAFITYALMMEIIGFM